MSASREKNKRKVQVEESLSSAAEKKGMSKNLKKALVIVCVVLAVAAVVFCTMLTDGFFAKHATAAKLGERKLSPAMVNYYYKQAVSDFNEYASMLDIDPAVPLTEQYLDEEKTESWADYLVGSALNSAASTYAVYDKAIADGYQLSDEAAQSIDSTIEMYSMYAPLNGFKTTDAFIAAYFGSGCNEESLREYMKVTSVANGYLNNYYNGLSYTDEEIEAEYAENKNNYDTVTYRLISVSSGLFEEGTENVNQLVKDLAEKIYEAADSEEAFIQACAENVPDAQKERYANENTTLRKDASFSYTSDAYSEWLFDEARQADDKTTIEKDGTYYVLLFLSRNDHDVVLPNVRHILIKVDDTTDTEAMAAAKEKAESILAQYEDGDKTEDSFASLAAQYSDDSSAQNGGLISNIYPDQMVQNFSDWCFDEGRQTGDTDIVETEYGYHVMYFVGMKNHKTTLVDSALKQNAFAAKSEELSANDGFTIVPFGAKFVTK